jgi:hypothetical protein
MEGDTPAEDDDWKFLFFDIRENFPEPKIVSKQFFGELLEVLKANPHYQALMQIKKIESDTGETLSINSCMIITAVGKDKPLNFNLLFHAISDDEYELIAMWPPAIIAAAIQNRGLIEMMVVRLAKSPEFFKNVLVFVPIPT